MVPHLLPHVPQSARVFPFDKMLMVTDKVLNLLLHLLDLLLVRGQDLFGQLTLTQLTESLAVDLSELMDCLGVPPVGDLVEFLLELAEGAGDPTAVEISDL